MLQDSLAPDACSSSTDEQATSEVIPPLPPPWAATPLWAAAEASAPPAAAPPAPADAAEAAPVGEAVGEAPPAAFAVLCEGRRLESGPLEDLPGFRKRAQGSFFQALLDSETDQFKDDSGALVIRGVPLASVEDAWRYLVEGLQPGPATLEEYCEWRRVCDFFALAVPDPLADVFGEHLAVQNQAHAFATHRYIMVRSVHTAGLSPLCYALRCDKACQLEVAPLGFDQVCLEGCLHLQALRSDPPLEVRLDPVTGALQVRFMREAPWQPVGKHNCLRQKRMVALKVRTPRQRLVTLPHAESAGCSMEVVELYLHVSPAGKKSHPALRGEDVCVATWPSFWCLVRIVRQQALKHETWSSWNATFEVMPGAVCLLADDLIVQVVAQPRSLHKCYLRICGGDLEHEVRAKLVAPAPFSTPHVRSGKGKAGFYMGAGMPGKGSSWGTSGPSLIHGKRLYKAAVPSFDTPTPEEAERNIVGRCMQQVWIIRRRNRPGAKPQLVVLMHSADGRVAVAQLSGDGGCIPPLYGVGGSSGPSRKTCAIWGAKAWHWSHQGIVGAIGQYRRSYDVPKCHQVMAMALQDDQHIVILHRPRARGSPQLWTISEPRLLGEDVLNGATSSFFRVHGKGRGAGGKNKGGKGNSIGSPLCGSWIDNRWGTADARQAVLPDDIVQGASRAAGGVADAAGCPLFVPLWTGGEASRTPKNKMPAGTNLEAPEVEVLRFDGRADVSEPQEFSRHARLANTPPLPLVSWHITGRLHYRCQEPVVPH